MPLRQGAKLLDCILNVDLTLDKTRLEKHLARVLQMKKGLRCSAILIETIEGLEADLQR
ncbi:hypothetical protein JJB99_08030 [Bradyrhizobium diazoefficiens]|uniref:hypothetical protein n=1 Tax=Bradyrhizobium diazoefficiens TaxID=1355477 RepID=UPI00190C06EE|nr:hypothetical protein [Bradyrhizobium diazoefficiens]QQO16089.1 hypothetical protein JJB99_08030 [Bradyrhizobium diazoefficiens]